MRFGRKNTVRKIFVPFSPRVSASAMAKAMMLMRMVETMVNFAVNQKAEVNVLSWKTLMKLSSPTNVVLLMVVNLWKERKIPHRKGKMKPMANAAKVGRRNKGQ